MNNDQVLKWYFGCVAIVAVVVALTYGMGRFAETEQIKREAVLLGYATDGPDGFKWKERVISDGKGETN